MIIIYYRDQDGKIKSFHENRENRTMDELKEIAEAFNQANEKTTKTVYTTAYITEVPDNSLTAYLFQKAQERQKWDEDALREAINAIENALDAVNGLGCW